MPHRDLISWNAMLAATASLQEARSLFDAMPQRNVASWSTMITALHGSLIDARALFDQMPQHDSVTWNTMLGAYIQSNCLVQARELFVAMPVRDTASWTASAQRGNVLQAGKIFSTLPDRSIVSWNAMIHGCAQNGHERKAAEFFGSMAMEGEARNEISFQAILLTCNHGGKLRVALDYFRSMVAEYSISPNVIHFQAMADVLGRAGLVAEAEGLLLVMPFQPHFLAWKSLISACKVHGSGKNIDVAARAGDETRGLGALLMSNLQKQLRQPL